MFRNRNRRGRIWLPLSAILLGLSLTSVLLFLFFQSSPSQSRRYLSFSVNQAESFQSVAKRLAAEGLVRSEKLFYYLGRITGKSGGLRAGEYELNSQMSNWEILNIVTGSHVRLYKVTLKEGFTIFQVAKTLDHLGLVDEIQFLEACWDRSFLEELQIPSFTVEGYLFPETYFIPRGSSPRRIIRMLVEMFWSKIPDEFLERARNGPLSFHEAVILASVIEKETGLAGEMGLISSVFHNRLKKGMRLQSDPTAIYDIAPYGGKVTRQHLFRKTPYNTYQIPALPIAPISNPGILAIYAALHPQQSDYLYFVSRRDSSHHFTKTYEEHKEGINRYLK